MAKKRDPRVAAAFHEVYSKVPKTVKATGKTGEAKRKMMTAVALSKARAAGAKIPEMHEGGDVKKDGVYELKKGEHVTPSGEKAPTIKIKEPSIKVKVKGADAVKAFMGNPGNPGNAAEEAAEMKEEAAEEKPVPGIHSRVTRIKTEPATQFPLHKLPAAMEIPKNTEGAPIPGTHSSTSAHPALANRALEHFKSDGEGGDGPRTRTAAGVTSRPGHEVTAERQAHVAKHRAAKEDAFKTSRD